MAEFFDQLLSADALFATLSSFALILVLARVKVPLSIAVLAGAAALGAMFDLGAERTALAAFEGMISPKSIGLGVITVLLLGLTRTMRSSGQLTEIVDLAKSLLRRPAVAMAAMPALIGILPMPGGALFSAPMVESAAGEGRETAGRLSAINYWYRHIWEHWWPLYPGALLALASSGRSMGAFMMYQFPLGAFMAVAGLVIFRKLHPDLHVRGQTPPKGTKRRLMMSTSSIWIVPLIWAAGTVTARLALAASGLSGDEAKEMQWLWAGIRYGPLVCGLIVSLIWTSRLNSLGLRGLGGVFSRWSIYGLLVLILSIMAFQNVLHVTRAGAEMGSELQAMRVAAVLVVAVLPFIAGMVTGLAVGFVGITFPILNEMVAPSQGGVMSASYMVLAYACGHLGMMLSPLHVCHVVSNKYFGTTFGPTYRRIFPAAGITLVLAVIYFLTLRMAGV